MSSNQGTQGAPGVPGPAGPQGPEGGATPALSATIHELARELRRLRHWVLVALIPTGVSAVVLVVLLVAQVRLSNLASGLEGVAVANKANGDILVDCTTPTPKPTPEVPEPVVHECYERGGRATGAAVAELRRSTDCVGYYFAGERPPACEDVAARMDALGRGENPFATTTTTTTRR